eukprot:gnl/TRDRNA2_/TRDRNA2_85173_c0_seq1.p1 gnl/TRDRNA2_/TRDRNA2_85173_c0~~gnl/TRDRNA2_/TRDRNA2_85173_c0_seq1.p1  ORF type:complete len:417 (-),score=64.77 gnl/TRDRNA2_/TRDRNA2_85173_c0_seq1:85-1335(-)
MASGVPSTRYSVSASNSSSQYVMTTPERYAAAGSVAAPSQHRGAGPVQVQVDLTAVNRPSQATPEAAIKAARISLNASAAAAASARPPQAMAKGQLLAPGAQVARLANPGPSPSTAAAAATPPRLQQPPSPSPSIGSVKTALTVPGSTVEPVSLISSTKASAVTGASGYYSTAAAEAPIAHLATTTSSTPASAPSLEQLIARLTASLARREEALKEQEQVQDKKQIRELTHSRGPEWPRCRRRPPFAWQPSSDYEKEFQVSGENGEIVTKINDFEDENYVVPAAGTLRLTKGGVYRWTLCIERKSTYRPQIQLGVHGTGHRWPWRLLATSRCSRARDDEAWQDRPGGDRAIEGGDFVHIEVDLRGLHLPFGTLSLAINGEQPEVVFNDLPLDSHESMMPVVSMGGDRSRVRLCAAY